MLNSDIISLPSAPRILIFQTAFLGDVILSTPLASALKVMFSSSHITFLVTPPLDRLIREHPDIDEVLLFDKRGKSGGAIKSVGISLEVFLSMR